MFVSLQRSKPELFQPLLNDQGGSSTFAKVKSYIENNFPDLMDSFDHNAYVVWLAENKGYDAFVDYMTKPQFFQVVTREAKWLNLINIGHHALLRLPGDRKCEWSPTPRDVPVNQWTQLELRQATGGTIERIWQTHQQLETSYHSISGFLSFEPFTNDCFTYVDRLLTATGERPTQLTRFLAPSCASFEKLIVS